MKVRERRPITAWLVVRPAGSEQRDCNVWAEYHEVLPSGVLTFYNVDADLSANEWPLTVAPGSWADVRQVEAPTLPDVFGREPRHFRKVKE